MHTHTYIHTHTHTHIYHFIHTVTLLHVSALKGPSSGRFDTFREQGLPNMCPDVNIRFKSSVLFARWQLSN